MPTIIGLVTAGLTVVFQDFIVAFFGWFVLMGKQGIRVGDWVEINGVGGEVAEVGLFRTTLLETGNWTDKGHPTGRRINFMNGFAIRGQYFNFSTSGQWLWDEITVNIPSGPHTYQIIDDIHTAVQHETEQLTKLAVTEWQRATGAHDMGQFSAEPAVDLRPASSGVDVIVRYVTRASDRFSIRNRIYQTVIDLMQKKEETAALEVGEKPV
jgi:small-conductance mechanosensitive channel